MLGLALIVILSFGVGAVLGAPFVPTHRKSVTAALELAQLQPGQHLLDLGSGSGSLILAAAKHGIYATGIEINPVLWLISNMRIWPYKEYARIMLGDYWQMRWPKTDCIYIFLIGHYMPRFSTHLHREVSKPTTIVSYTFEVPGLQLESTVNGLHLYRYKP